MVMYRHAGAAAIGEPGFPAPAHTCYFRRQCSIGDSGYALDANGNRTGVTTPTGSAICGYDVLNRLIDVSYTNGDTVSCLPQP